jgi:hypothetical protein
MNDRSILAQKLLCTCPICQRRIYGGTLGLNEIDISKIKKFPFAYTYIHSHSMQENIEVQNLSKHAITLFFDANLSVRAVEESQLMKIDQ